MALTHVCRRATVTLLAIGQLACADALVPPSNNAARLIPTLLLATFDPATAAGAPTTIDSTWVRSDTLYLVVSYTGGCQEHEFQLVLSTSFLESEPVQTLAALSHDDNDDACEALLTDVLRATLEPIKLEWQRSYQSQSGTIIIRLWTPTEPITVSYTF